MFVNSASTFYVLRFLLGAAEAGFFPGMILYLTYWFPVEARGRAVARFMTATAMAGVIGGPLSGFLLKMNGTAGLAGWQWLFLMEGLPAVILGVLVFKFLPDRPEAAEWLSADEKAWIISTVAEEGEAQRLHGHSTLGEALRSFRVWSFAFVYFAVVISFYGISLWLPQIVKSLSNVSDLLVGFIAAIPFIAASIGMVIIGRSSDHRNERRWHVAGSAFVGTIGLVLAGLFNSPAAEVAALSLAAVGIWGSLGPFWAMSSQFLTGTAAAAGIALINSIGNLGGFAGPYLIGVVRSRTNNFALALFALAACPLMGGMVTLCLRLPILKKNENTANGQTFSHQQEGDHATLK
jgi:ACS family tartrate transporter-like MFS transporter